MAYQSQDIIRRSATNGLTPAPQARDFQEEVAKLIDVTTCIGCKACQVACSEWNDIRDTVGNNIGVYDNPNDLSAKSWTVMRFSEVEQNDKLEWLIRKDGCMHCADPGCLKACPSPKASSSPPSSLLWPMKFRKPPRKKVLHLPRKPLPPLRPKAKASKRGFPQLIAKARSGLRSDAGLSCYEQAVCSICAAPPVA